MNPFRREDAAIFLLPVIRGLVSETQEVERAIEETGPDAVGICVSSEELEALGMYDGQEAEPASAHEEAYVNGLRRFGEVRKPPPCYAEGLAVARRLRIPCMAIDMDEDLYTEAYCNFVSVVDVMRQTRDSRTLPGKKFEADTPWEFVMKFDSYVNRHRGFERLELERERYIAMRLSRMADKWSRIISLVEAERANGVLENLRRLLSL